MKEVKEVLMKVAVFAIDEKCEHCPNLVFESLGTKIKCKNAPICWNALEMREGEADFDQGDKESATVMYLSAIAKALVEIRDELRKMNGGDRDA